MCSGNCQPGSSVSLKPLKMPKMKDCKILVTSLESPEWQLKTPAKRFINPMGNFAIIKTPFDTKRHTLIHYDTGLPLCNGDSEILALDNFDEMVNCYGETKMSNYLKLITELKGKVNK